MTHWLRTTVVVLAIAAIAVASYAPRFAHASMLLGASLEHAAQSHQEHEFGVSHATPCREGGDADNGAGDVDAQKYCCAAACAASAFIFSAVYLPDSPHQRAGAMSLLEQLRSIAPSALDPPPRAV